MQNHILFILAAILGLYLANPVFAFFFGVGISFFGISKNLKHLDRIGSCLLKIAIILLGLVFDVNSVSGLASESFLLVLGLVILTSFLGVFLILF